MEEGNRKEYIQNDQKQEQNEENQLVLTINIDLNNLTRNFNVLTID
jgi:hypothetical protein